MKKKRKTTPEERARREENRRQLVERIRELDAIIARKKAQEQRAGS